MTTKPIRFAGASRPVIRLLVIGAASVLGSVSAGAPAEEAPLDLTELRVRVSRLDECVTELAGKDDLPDTLHFGWFDRAYARATLAILVKTVSVLEREVYLRELGNGAISDATVRTMLGWAETAPERVIAEEPHSAFRPHRLRTTGVDFPTTATTPPLYAFVDRVTATRHDDVHGDLDLLAAIGMRVYPRILGDLADADSTNVAVARAAALGMGTVLLAADRDGAITMPRDLSGNTGAVCVVCLRDIIDGTASTPGVVYALSDPVAGEPWAASLARRALARGAFNNNRHVTVDWAIPHMDCDPADRAAGIAAAMWVNAIEGQSLGLLPGWRDLRDGSGSLHPSAFLDPARVEAIARTALDLIRLGGHVRPFGSTPPLALTVGPDAVHTRDDNAWASWVTPVFDALLARQIRFDILAAHANEQGLRRYPVVFPLRPDDVGDPESVMLRIEHAVAVESGHVHRVTARRLDGRFADEVFVRDGRTSAGRPCVTLVNLSGRPRRVNLRGGLRLGVVRDLLGNEHVTRSDEPISLAPWQVRLLWPSD